MLEWLWILLTHTLCARNAIRTPIGWKMERHTIAKHIHPAQRHNSPKQTKSKPRQVLSRWMLVVGISYLLSLHSRTSTESFEWQHCRFIILPVRCFEFTKHRLLLAVISFFLLLLLPLVDAAIATGAVDTNFAKYNTIHNTQSTKRLTHYDAFHSVSATSNKIWTYYLLRLLLLACKWNTVPDTLLSVAWQLAVGWNTQKSICLFFFSFLLVVFVCSCREKTILHNMSTELLQK